MPATDLFAESLSSALDSVTKPAEGIIVKDCAEKPAFAPAEARKIKPTFTIIVDTREQLPLRFPAPTRRELSDGGVIRYVIDAGDYACTLDGGEYLPVRIERKSVSDYFGVVGNGRERFERELQKLSAYHSYLLIEATADEIRAGYERSKVHGEAALCSALAWSIDYGVMPIFAGNRRMGAHIAHRLLQEYAIKFLRHQTER